MADSQVLQPTKCLKELIDKLAGSSLELSPEDGEKVLAEGMEVFKYNENKIEVYWSLSKEYYQNMVPIVRESMREVILHNPKKRPTLFRYIKGWLSTTPDEAGALVPILDQTSEKVNIRVKNKAGVVSRDEVYIPYTIILLSAEVRFEFSAPVLVLLYLHPTSRR